MITRSGVVIYSTSPGNRRPAEGAMLMSASSGGVKENSLGTSGVVVALVTGPNGCLDALRSVCLLIR